MVETAISQTRFGYGFGPNAGPVTRDEMRAQAQVRDTTRARFPTLSMTEALTLGRTFREANQALRAGHDGAEDRYEAAQQGLRVAAQNNVQTAFARIADSTAPLRERLVWFWADHFTAVPSQPVARAAAGAYLDEAIRPHVMGRFSDMLRAVMTNPMMLYYLDQHVSVGPDSPLGQQREAGLNENLARELIELHTLGAGADYSQIDIREAAELLTGLTIDLTDGFVFRPLAAQPGPETILGRTYGSDGQARLSDIEDFLEDLARRPETAQHLARKMAVHFLADDPPDALVQALAETYRSSNGHLGRMTHTLVNHPTTADASLQKAKTPMEFVASTLVALGFSGDEVMALSGRDFRRMIILPMAAMGQQFMRPSGPDGWSEDPRDWITPQGLASRISWAAAVAEHAADRAGDPRDFLDRTLGALAGDRLRFAVSAAETREDGIALTLASAEFNRR